MGDSVVLEFSSDSTRFQFLPGSGKLRTGYSESDVAHDDGVTTGMRNRLAFDGEKRDGGGFRADDGRVAAPSLLMESREAKHLAVLRGRSLDIAHGQRDMVDPICFDHLWVPVIQTRSNVPGQFAALHPGSIRHLLPSSPRSKR